MYEKPTIQILAEKLIPARGLDYQVAFRALKFHLSGLDEVSFLAEMTKVTNPDIFRYLWAAGMPYSFQQIASRRWEELTE